LGVLGGEAVGLAVWAREKVVAEKKRRRKTTIKRNFLI